MSKRDCLGRPIRPGVSEPTKVRPILTDDQLCAIANDVRTRPPAEAARHLMPLIHHAAALAEENEQTASRLADCWLLLDAIARSDCLLAPRMAAAAILRKQQAPGWKE